MSMKQNPILSTSNNAHMGACNLEAKRVNLLVLTEVIDIKGHNFIRQSLINRYKKEHS